MKRKILAPILVLAVLAMAACERNANQPAGNLAAGGNTNAAAGASGAAGGPVAAGDILTSFPDSQAIMFANGERIVEAIRRVVPPERYDQMFAEAQREMGFDPRLIRIGAVGFRVREPITSASQPEFLVVIKGNITPDLVITQMAKEARGGRRQEPYNGRNIEILTMRAPYTPPPGSTYTPPPDPFNEMAVVGLSGDTVAFGVLGYVRSAIDAADGRSGRLRQDLISVVTSNSDSLVSMAGDVPSTFADFLRAQGMMRDPEANRILSSLRQIQAFVTMSGSDFGIQLNAKMDSADSANYLNGLIARMKMEFQTQLQSAPPPPNPNQAEDMRAALTLLNSITNTANGDTVSIGVTIPQSFIQSQVQRQMR